MSLYKIRKVKFYHAQILAIRYLGLDYGSGGGGGREGGEIFYYIDMATQLGGQPKSQQSRYCRYTGTATTDHIPLHIIKPQSSQLLLLVI